MWRFMARVGTGKIFLKEVFYRPVRQKYRFFYILIITEVQASGVIIDRLMRQCCFVWSEIVGPHSSGNFND